MNRKDRIKQVARLEEVVERYLPLKRSSSSGKTLTGLCPFHADRHPSLCVNIREQYYKCFACGAGGDVFRFVQEMEGCDFRKALDILAGWYGLPDTDDIPLAYTPAKKMSPIKPEAHTIVSQLHIDHLLRSHRMISDLLETYIPEADILRETYKAFEIGVAPAALPASYVDMCDRLIFPIRNERGELVAFAGRYRGETKGTDIHKYVNSPDSPVYHKSEILYGLYQAREAICEHHFVFVTEGYKDVLAMHAAGFRNTVALCGTALTDQQITLLSRYTRYAIIMLDGDEAGQTNGIRSARLLVEKGFSVGRIVLESGHDPDSLLCMMGREDFTGYIKRWTRISWLEVYETDLLRQIKQLLADLHLALTVAERTDLFARMLPLHKRLEKVTRLLAHSPVMKAEWLLD